MTQIPWEALMTFLGMCVAGLAWLIRIEVRGFYTRKDIERVETLLGEEIEKKDREINKLHDRIDGVVTKHDEMIHEMLDKLSRIESMVSRIEGQLEQ